MFLSKLQIATAVLVGMVLVLVLGLAVSNPRTLAQTGSDKQTDKPAAVAPRGGEPWLECHSARTLTLRPNVWTPGSKGAAEFETIEYEADVKHAVTSPDDKWLAVVTADGTLHVHELQTRRNTETIAVGGKGRKVTGVRFSPDGKRIAVVGDDAAGKGQGESVAARSRR